MEWWEGQNYYTKNNTKWTQLMNMSCEEWGLGWFPSNVIAIPGPFNDSWAYMFPPDTIFIENASETDVGDRSIEGVVFGLASAIVLSWAVGWFIRNIRKKTLLLAHFQTVEANSAVNSSAASQNTGATAVTRGIDNEEGAILGHAVFVRLVKEFYPNESTELELYEKSPDEAIDVQDVEAVADLLRKMLLIDLVLWGRDGMPKVSGVERERDRARSDALLGEARKLINTWNNIGLNQSEDEDLKEIRRVLSKNIPHERYIHRRAGSVSAAPR
jgi:hypothetical protein